MVGKVGLAILLPAALFLLPGWWCGLPALGVLVAMVLVVFYLRIKAQKSFGGITGDVLGAAIEWSEAVGWLVAAGLAGHQ